MVLTVFLFELNRRVNHKTVFFSPYTGLSGPFRFFVMACLQVRN